MAKRQASKVLAWGQPFKLKRLRKYRGENPRRVVAKKLNHNGIKVSATIV
jgi:hypothetical protein